MSSGPPRRLRRVLFPKPGLAGLSDLTYMTAALTNRPSALPNNKMFKQFGQRITLKRINGEKNYTPTYKKLSHKALNFPPET